MFFFGAGVRISLSFEKKNPYFSVFPSLFSLERFKLPQRSHFFLPFPPKPERRGIRTERNCHHLQRVPTPDPIKNRFRAPRPRLSAVSFRGTYRRFPAGPRCLCQGVVLPSPPQTSLQTGSVNSHSRPELRWSQDPKHLLGWARAAPLEAADILSTAASQNTAFKDKVQPNEPPQTFQHPLTVFLR